MGIRVTDAAFARVDAILKAEKNARALRVAVLGGGCSGFQYRFELADSVEQDDLVFESAAAKVVIDPVSAPFLENAVIDFKDELIGAHFAIVNPNAASSCGCGTSFSI